LPPSAKLRTGFDKLRTGFDKPVLSYTEGLRVMVRQGSPEFTEGLTMNGFLVVGNGEALFRPTINQFPGTWSLH